MKCPSCDEIFEEEISGNLCVYRCVCGYSEAHDDVGLLTTHYDDIVITSKTPDILVKGSVRLLKSSFEDRSIKLIKNRLTVEGRAYQDNPVITVKAFREDDYFLWVPRHSSAIATEISSYGYDVVDETSMGKTRPGLS